MIFQCSDLDRALEYPELLPDAHEHARTCARCSRQLHLWAELSRVAPQLHEEWETPDLWNRIRADLIPTVPRRAPAAHIWRLAVAAAAVVLLAAILWRPWRSAPSHDFLTEE